MKRKLFFAPAKCSNTSARGFSLVELMISLIAISLITAALAPAITKKLSAGTITIGSFGGGGGGGGGEAQECSACPDGYFSTKNSYNECICQKCSDTLNHCTKCTSATRCEACENGYQIDVTINQCISAACAETGGKPSESCCAEFKSKFISKDILGTSYDLCMMQYNVGDDGNMFKVNGMDVVYQPDYVKYGISVDRAGNSYPSHHSPAQCWRGTTSSGSSPYSNYNANNRMVCDYEAAKIACAIWAPNGSKKGAWRLLSENEAIKVAAKINSETSTDTTNNLSKYLNETGLQLCSHRNSNYGMNHCPIKDYCSGASNAYCFPGCNIIESGKCFGNSNDYGNIAVWSDNVTYGYSIRCVTSNVYQALATNESYNQDDSEPVDEYEPQSQADCDPYNALYINKKFIGGNKNICMFKYNAGDDFWLNDDDTFYHPDYIKLGISVDRAGNSYPSHYSPAQCWRGTTSDGSGSYSYSPSTRMVCDYEAAKKLCAGWSYKNTNPGDWRLLTEAEATALASWLNIDSYYASYFSKYLSQSGLQLCSHRNSNYGMNHCPIKDYCRGASNSYCFPGCNIIESGKCFGNSNDSGNIAVWSDNVTYGYSVRCVSNKIRGGHAPIKTYSYLENEPSKQEDCDKYSALFIDKHLIKNITGIELTRSLCMTKYNMADKNITNTSIKTYIGNNEIEDYANIGVTMVEAGTTCSSGSVPCCWRGDTSSGSSPYSYNANSRTVCNYAAAKLLCQNWNPTNDISKGKWRLLTEDEAAALASALNIDSYYASYFSKYLNQSGLQLCSHRNSNYGMNHCPIKDYCSGASNAYCFPGCNIIESGKCFGNSNDYGNIAVWSDNVTYGYSVRCVSDTIKTE